MRLSSLTKTINKTTVVRFFTTGFIIFLLIFIYKQFNKNFSFSNEIWIGLATTIGTTYYQYQYQKNKERIEASAKAKDEVFEEFNVRITAVSNSIRRFETRVDSVLLNLKKFENTIEELEKNIEDVETKINQNEIQLLRDRFELYRVFFNEILSIRTDLAKVKGVQEPTNTVDEMLVLVEKVLNKKNVEVKTGSTEDT